MKYTNTIETEIQSCGPNIKELKQVLKSQKEAKKMLEDLDTNNHLHYDMSAQILGRNLYEIDRTKKAIKALKKQKKGKK